MCEIDPRKFRGARFSCSIAVLCFWVLCPSVSLAADRGHMREWAAAERPCRVAADLLGSVSDVDYLMENLEDIAYEALSSTINEGELSPEDSAQIERLLDSLSIRDLGKLPPALLHRIGPSLATSLQETLRDGPMYTGKSALEGVNDYVTSLLLPQPPQLPTLSSFEDCAQAKRFLSENASYSLKWLYWSRDLQEATGAPGKDYQCEPLDPHYYSKLASAFRALAPPMAELGRVIDLLMQSRVTEADYYSTLEELSELAGRIRDRLEEINRRGNKLYALEKRKKQNFDSNVQLILAPAYNNRCTATQTDSRGRRAGIPTVMPQVGTNVTPQSAPQPSTPPLPVTLLTTNISVSCYQTTGQKCSELWARQVSLPRSGKLEIHYRVPPTHCSPLFFTISVDGQRASDTDLLSWHGAPSSYLRILEARVVTGSLTEGTHRVEMQAYGEKGGCNSGRLSAYGGNVTVTLH